MPHIWYFDSLDTTYKIQKYALPLFFAVVKTNVNIEVVGVLIFQEETKDMIKKGLQIKHEWNPTVTPKFGMVDFDEKENQRIRGIISACWSVFLQFLSWTSME